MVKKFLFLNGLAVLGAVLYHATGWGYTALIWWADRYRDTQVPDFQVIGTIPYYALRFIEQLIIYSIPAFLFVSGYFIAFAAGRGDQKLGWSVVMARIRKLVMPFLLWSLLILIANKIEGQDLGITEVFEVVLTGQTAPPYYFVPVLVQLFLLAPILVPVARNKPVALLSFAALLTFFVAFLRYIQLLGWQASIPPIIMFLARSWFFPGYLLWFTGGMLIGFHLNKSKPLIVKFRWFALSMWVIFFILGMVEWEIILKLSGKPWIGSKETLVDQLFAIAFLLTYLGFENFVLPFNKQIADIGTKSYGIYLIHSPVLEYSSRLIYHIAPAILGMQIIFQPLIIVLGLVIPLIMMSLVNNTPVRKYYDLIFG